MVNLGLQEGDVMTSRDWLLAQSVVWPLAGPPVALSCIQLQVEFVISYCDETGTVRTSRLVGELPILSSNGLAWFFKYSFHQVCPVTYCMGHWKQVLLHQPCVTSLCCSIEYPYSCKLKDPRDTPELLSLVNSFQNDFLLLLLFYFSGT